MTPNVPTNNVVILSLLRYICLDREMEEIGRVWKVAKEQLLVHHQELKRVGFRFSGVNGKST